MDMTPEQTAAYVNANAMSAYIEAVGMAADNGNALMMNEVPLPHSRQDFLDLLNHYGINQNGILKLYEDNCEHKPLPIEGRGWVCSKCSKKITGD